MSRYCRLTTGEGSRYPLKRRLGGSQSLPGSFGERISCLYRDQNHVSSSPKLSREPHISSFFFPHKFDDGRGDFEMTQNLRRRVSDSNLYFLVSLQFMLTFSWYGARAHLTLNLLKPTGYVMHQQFNIQQLYFCPHCIYVFCIYLRSNSDLCHLQHKLIGFYNRDEKCLLRGTNWVFK